MGTVRADGQATKDELDVAEKALVVAQKEYADAEKKIEEAEAKLQEMNEKIETADKKLEEASDKVSALEQVTVELGKQLEESKIDYEKQLEERKAELDESKADVDGRVTREAEEDARTTEALALFEAARGLDAEARAAALDSLEQLLQSLLLKSPASAVE